MNYPSGKKYIPNQNIQKKTDKHTNAANRGMSLENLINESNNFYYANDICLITKRPTPINVVKVDYSHGAKIVDAYFEKQSTTDYNGVYKGKYIDFEAKSTMSKTSFPLHNIYDHQINHLKKVIRHNGIAFFIIELAYYNEYYLLDAQVLITFIEINSRKSIPLESIKKQGYKIKLGLQPTLDYIEIVESIYFKN